MTYDAKRAQPQADEQTARAPETDDKRTSPRALERVTNWAWSSNCGPYDWMDSHTPVAGLD